MTTHAVKYGAILSPANLAGDSLDIAVPSDVQGGFVTRTVADGDRVAAVTISPDETALPDMTVVVYEVQGDAFIIDGDQPQPGDLIVATCPEDDVPHQAGSITVVADNGTVTPAQFGLVFGALAMLPQPPVPHTLTPMEDVAIEPGDGVVVVSFDTTDQPCALALPELAEPRLMLVANRNGPNDVTVSIPANPYALHGPSVASGALTLTPGQRVVLASIGAGWDSTAAG